MSKSRLRSYIEDTVGPSTILREGAAAGIGQAKNSPPEWGGGVEGYAKRFGSDMAELAVRNSIAYPLAAALHEDHRYFASGKTSVRGRFWHAALSPFEARRPDGSVGFSYSNVAAVAGASIISRAWAPPSWDTPGNAVADFGLTLAGEAAFNVFREFLPDFLHRRH